MILMKKMFLFDFLSKYNVLSVCDLVFLDSLNI